jgi:hypothetical protein
MWIYANKEVLKMTIFDFFKRNNDQYKNDFFQKNDLEDWWLSKFTNAERKYIMAESSTLLDSRYNHDKSPGKVLYLLAGYINTKNTKGYQHLAKLILDKAVQVENDPIILFKIYSQLIKLYFEQRNSSDEIKLKIIELCKKQIEISKSIINSYNNKEDLKDDFFDLEHQGYQKLAVLSIENGNLENAKKLIEEAKEEGWNGSWDKLELRLS